MGRMSLLQRITVLAIALVAVVVGVVSLTSGGSDGADKPAARSSADATASATASTRPGNASVREADLSPEAQQTIRRIMAGGPFPYARDGVVFENREGLLPSEPSGFYHEFTVPTPGSSDRGARRVVSTPNGFYYYSPDHYRTFLQVVLS